ncbi:MULTISPECIES: GNAT family N-acetyltransferase [Paraliobacillus]|uniref:GNAT family N-acetyltransferase n=1 Tax=Paraliobacillus TaxID=200903 RepID=UPI000DD2F390|nr:MULTISPECIES: GNAT family N-acetyltransferase [Paraliobacillus]
MEWNLKTFENLSATEVYKILQARVDVFVVEQNCPYREIDGIDQSSMHLFLKNDGEVIAYARLIPKDTLYKEPSIGRVLVKKDFRGKGYANEVLKQAIAFITDEWKDTKIKLHGQVYLREFYRSFGFREVTEEYLEDGIPHVDMVLAIN